MKPIWILFGMSLTVTIYVSSDTTVLGILCGEYAVGIYSASVKVYTAVKTILSSILVVSIPRMSALLGGNDKHAFAREAADIYSTLLTFVLPAMLGIILMRKQIILLISGEEFISATSSLTLLAIALLFCMGAWFWGQCVMLPLKMESRIFQITVVSALVNIGLNFVLIPLWKENAAALTTILAEGLSFLGCWYYGRKYASISGIWKALAQIAAGCASIVATWWLMRILITDFWINTICTIFASVVVYVGVEALLGNPLISGIICGALDRVRMKSTRRSR